MVLTACPPCANKASLVWRPASVGVPQPESTLEQVRYWEKGGGEELGDTGGDGRAVEKPTAPAPRLRCSCVLPPLEVTVPLAVVCNAKAGTPAGSCARRNRQSQRLGSRAGCPPSTESTCTRAPRGGGGGALTASARSGSTPNPKPKPQTFGSLLVSLWAPVGTKSTAEAEALMFPACSRSARARMCA